MNFWLSFCDPSRPHGRQFLGGCVVEASDIASAIKIAHVLGCNPGGEVLAVSFDGDPPPARWCNRLLSRAECAAMDRAMLVSSPQN